MEHSLDASRDYYWSRPPTDGPGKIVPIPQSRRGLQSSWSLLKRAWTWPSVTGALAQIPAKREWQPFLGGPPVSGTQLGLESPRVWLT